MGDDNPVMRFWTRIRDQKKYKVRKSGSTHAITIPESWLKFNDWLKSPRLVVTLGDGVIIISTPEDAPPLPEEK